MATTAQIPWKDDVVAPSKDPRSGRSQWLISKAWGNFMIALRTISDASAQIVAEAALSNQSASIATTALVASAAAGLYRVTWRIRVTTADGVGSSILVTILSTDNTVACSQASTAYVGNAVNAPQSGVFLVQADAATAISYATTYASGGGGPAMVYELEIKVEQM